MAPTASKTTTTNPSEETTPSKMKVSASNSYEYSPSLNTNTKGSSSSRSSPRRNRYLVCITILISASLIIIVFLGPLFISDFPSLSDRADILIHKEENEQLLGVKSTRTRTQQQQQQQYSNVPDYAPSKSEGQPQTEHEVQPMNLQLRLDNLPTSAAEKLECPAKVVSFVVNATDIKDECDGLRKAFDQTCGGSTKKKKKKSETDGIGSRRRLMDGFSHADGNTDTDTDAGIISNTLTWSPVRNYLKKKLNNLKQTGKRRLLSEDEQENDGKPPQAEEPEEKTKPLSPSLPTASSEVAEVMATDALALNANLEDIAKAIEDIHDHTDTAHTAQEKKHHSQDKGSGSHSHSHTQHHDTSSADEEDELKSTAVAVSAVINNPKAIETQVCCKSILTVFHEECDTPEEEEFNDKRLFVIVCVIALCGLVKSLIRHFKLRWMPEAGGCIIVGMVGGMFLSFLPSMDFGFQHDMFLRLMVPPIVFEAALNINKRSFSQMAVPIVIFAVWGTFMSTLLTAAIVYYGSAYFTMCTSIPFVESLAFGALISSIDPIAVLSVLNNMGMSDKDPIYVLIFGESLLNDGVAIVLFQTLVHFMDSHIVIDSEACWLATLHFLVIAFGSLFVGLTCGVAATVYFWLMKGIQTPLVEVSMFLCWAFIPYYICDGVDWSGIVSIVAAGFFMDVYVIGSKKDHASKSFDYNDASMLPENGHANVAPSRASAGVFSQEGFLSVKAKNHIRFVTEINATLMETAIFAYLGIFLINKRYHWSVLIALIGIISCVASRSLTVVFSSAASNMLTRIGQMGHRRIQNACAVNGMSNSRSRPQTTEIDLRMQLVLIFSGLRGAMSFALVETVPMFDPVTGEGSRFKPELKAMTSSCIFFTIFILGGYTYYLLDRMGMGPVLKDEGAVEMVSLINGGIDEDENDEDPWAGGMYKREKDRDQSCDCR